MQSIQKHIIEYYQQNKFLGAVTLDVEVSDKEIGWANQRLIKNGDIKLKKRYKATEQNPIVLSKYNLYGKNN